MKNTTNAEKNLNKIFIQSEKSLDKHGISY